MNFVLNTYLVTSFLQKMDVTNPPIPADDKEQKSNKDKLMEQRRKNTERVRRQ